MRTEGSAVAVGKPSTRGKMVKLVCALVGQEGSAFPVDIEPTQLVGDLKDAIKKENEDIKCAARKLQLFLAKKDGAWLSDDDPAALQLEDGNANDDIETMIGGEPMKATWAIQEWLFEKSKMPQTSTNQIHVLVVVPKQEAVQVVSQAGVFVQCSDQFFSYFSTAEEVNDWLEFPSMMPLTELRKLYVRPSYKVIAEQALSKVDPNRRKYVVITSTPGIGKSVFLYYVMWRLIKEKKRVLFLTRKPPIYFDGRTIWKCDQLPKPGVEEFWSPNLWCLVD